MKQLEGSSERLYRMEGFYRQKGGWGELLVREKKGVFGGQTPPKEDLLFIYLFFPHDHLSSLHPLPSPPPPHPQSPHCCPWTSVSPFSFLLRSLHNPPPQNTHPRTSFLWEKRRGSFFVLGFGGLFGFFLMQIASAFYGGW